jgi:hypothetical protein
MTPAFGLVETRALHPYLVRCSDSVGRYPLQSALYRELSLLATR